MQISQDQRNTVILWYLLQHSTRTLHKLIQYFGDAETAIQQKNFSIWQELKLHKNHLERFKNFYTPQGQQNFDRILEKITQSCDAMIFAYDDAYPEQLIPFQEHIPILFVKGNVNLLKQPQIAMVGSRNPSPHGNKLAFDFADYFCQKGYVITSGLAAGIDAAAHQGSFHQGQTIAVVGTGLDQCYPTQNQNLQQQILQQGGAIVSQFLPETPPIKVNFPKRNYIISALSLGTLVVEASLNSGSLITAKTAADQGKQVFAIPGNIASPHHQGCHQLIREGATLVDHPQQVLDDLNAFNPVNVVASNRSLPDSPTSSLNSSNIDLPIHLETIYHALTWEGVSVDYLTQQLDLPIQQLNAYLTELELLGLCQQHAGRYLRHQ